MIPKLVSLSGSPWTVLPPGVHPATLLEVEVEFSYNSIRRTLYAGLVDAAVQLAAVGCQTILLAVTSQGNPYRVTMTRAGSRTESISANLIQFLVISPMAAQIKKLAFTANFFPQP
jgi:hypothetical protein